MTRSNIIWLIIFGIVIIFIYWGISSLNLQGTPPPIKTIAVDDPGKVIYDVSEPRWTCYEFDFPNNIILEIEAWGQYYWDSLDARGPIGPEGAEWTPSQMYNQHQFIPGLHGKPFAGLIGKVGKKGKVFFIGKRCEIEIKKGGNLYIGINYRWVRRGGKWRVNWKFAKGTVIMNVKWEKKYSIF